MKLLEHGMKVLEGVLQKRLRQKVKIDDMQFGFVPGKGNSGCNLHGETVTGEILGKEKGLILYICGFREGI